MDSAKTKAHTALDEVSDKGAFVRVETAFRNWISEDSEKFKPEAGRYHLYVSYACPWANRTLIALALKGLEEHISVSVVHPTWQKTRPEEDEHTGWVFRDEKDPPLSNTNGFGSFNCEDCIPDFINNTKTLRELYEKSNDTLGKYTVPVLWDKKLDVIVNNESAEIVRMLNFNFNSFAKNKDLDLYPQSLRELIDERNQWIYDNINNGVYKCGFAKSQEKYEEAFHALFSHLDKVEDILSKTRYICGNQITETDIRLFVTLVRFDEVYVVYFKTNKKRIADYPNILNYCRDVYQLPGVKKTINMRHIKTHYFTSHPTLNHYGIIPVGPGVINDLEKSHDRERFN